MCFKGLEGAVLSMVLCTIQNPWSHLIGVGHSPDFALPSVAILPSLCRKRRKALFTHTCVLGKIHLRFLTLIVAAILPYEGESHYLITWKVNHWAHGVVATLNQRHWRWFNVVTTSCVQWEARSADTRSWFSAGWMLVHPLPVKSTDICNYFA